MGYYLGVDLGTTYTAAAIFKDDNVSIFPLGDRAASIPSVVFLKEDETILTGDAAERRAVTEPSRVAREFKRRIGDSTPLIVGGSPYSAEALTARLLKQVVASVETREGAAPDSIGISHPANWGAFKIDLLRQAVELAGINPGSVTFITEPEAAAISYATEERVEPGEIVAVYDLGGGTFDAAVLRKTKDGFEIVGRPQGIERLGGIDFDAAVYAHVSRALGKTLDDLNPDDAAAMSAVARLQQDCVAAKEGLSSDTDATIPVMLPGHQTEIRLTRSEFESLIRPSLVDSIGALNRALESAQVAAQDVSSVLLVGGSSRVPLVSQLIATEIGRPISVDTHPKHAVARGVAIATANAHGAAHHPTPAQAPAVATPPPVVNPTVDPTSEAAPPVTPAASPVGAEPQADQVPTPVMPVAFEADNTLGAPEPPTVETPATAQAAANIDNTIHAQPDMFATQGDQTIHAQSDLENTNPAQAAPAAFQGSSPKPKTSPALLVGGAAGLAVLAVVAFFVISALTADGDGGVATDGTTQDSEEIAGDTNDPAAEGDTDGTDTDEPPADNETATSTTASTVPQPTFRPPEEIEGDALEVIANALFMPDTQQSLRAVDDEVTIIGVIFDETPVSEIVAGLEAIEGVNSVNATGLTSLPPAQQCTTEVRNNPQWMCITSVEWNDDGSVKKALFESDSGEGAFSINGGFHGHFYDGGRHSAAEAGVAGGASTGGGVWEVWDTVGVYEPATYFGPVEELCVRIANASHALDSLSSGNCWPNDGFSAG